MDLDGIFWTYLSDIDKYIVDISAFVSKTIDPKDGVLSGVSCHILLVLLLVAIIYISKFSQASMTHCVFCLFLLFIELQLF
jgi:hypothetical protein